MSLVPNDADILMGITKSPTWYKINDYISWKITQLTPWPGNLVVPALLEYSIELRCELHALVDKQFANARERVVIFVPLVQNEIEAYEHSAKQIAERKIFNTLSNRLATSVNRVSVTFKLMAAAQEDQRDWIRQNLCEVPNANIPE